MKKLLIVAATLGAVAYADERQVCDSHPWYKKISFEEMNALDAHELKQNSYAPIVNRSSVRKAESMLASVAAIPISPALAQTLTGRAINSWEHGNLFLIRGIRFPTKGGGNFVSYLDGRVLVRFSHLGPPGGAAMSAPIVALLPALPKVVFTLCTGAS